MIWVFHLLFVFTVSQGLEIGSGHYYSNDTEDLIGNAKGRGKRDIFGRRLGVNLESKKFIFRSEKSPEKHIQLKSVQRSLVSRFLPVWVATRDPKNRNEIYFRQYNEVMENIGEFKVYHDVEQSSAAVLFGKTAKWKGVIDYRYSIIDMPFNELQVNVFSSQPYVIHLEPPDIEIAGSFSVKPLPKTPQQHLRSRRDSNDNAPWPLEMYAAFATTPTRTQTVRCSTCDVEPLKLRRRRRELSKRVYPEVLVILSNDLLDKSQFPMTSYSNAVEYAISYLNAVDMMYAKLKNPSIEINIAGVIIEDEANLLPLKQSRVHLNHSPKIEKVTQAEASLIDMGKLFYNLKHKFPRDSYDFILILTKAKLYAPTSQTGLVLGLSVEIPIGVNRVNTEEHHQRILPMSMITDDNKMKSFLTTVHEIAHLMQVEHDSREGTDHGIMMSQENLCDTCLKWSLKSIREFSDFFRTKEHCYLNNVPRSLFKPGPRIYLEADQQCQCHGFQQSAHVPLTELANICGGKLTCKMGSRSFRGPRPMDGTPCGHNLGHNKVCWQDRCTTVNN